MEILIESDSTPKKARNLRVYLMTYSLTTQHFIKIPEDTIGLVGFGVVAATALSSQKNKQYIQKAIEVYNEN